MTTDMCQIRDCGAPTKNAAYVCDRCGDAYARDLKALVDTLDEELDATIAGTKGIDWRRGNTSGAGEPGLHVNWRAAALYRRLHLTLSLTVDHCLEVGTRHSSTTDTAPARTVPAMALWLTWRTDGLCLDPRGPRYVGDVLRMVEQVEQVVAWEPPELRFLGPCEICGAGHVYAEGDAIEALCNRCEAAFPAEARRVGLLARMDDQLLTSAQIAELTTYLGLHDSRQRVQWRVTQWHKRKRIDSRGHDVKGYPRFRFGDVYPMLIQAEVAASG